MMKEHTVEEFRKAVTAGTPVEAIGRVYGLAKGPGESESELAARIEMLLETKPYAGKQVSMKTAYANLEEDGSITIHGIALRPK